MVRGPTPAGRVRSDGDRGQRLARAGDPVPVGTAGRRVKQPGSLAAGRPRMRVGVAVVATAVTLGVAVAAAVLAPRLPLLLVETLSSRSADVLRRAGSVLPLGYAFVAGMVAAVNPCGFVLLPAWLSAYASDRAGAGGASPVRHSISVALSLTGGVVSL